MGNPPRIRPIASFSFYEKSDQNMAAKVGEQKRKISPPWCTHFCCCQDPLAFKLKKAALSWGFQHLKSTKGTAPSRHKNRLVSEPTLGHFWGSQIQLPLGFVKFENRKGRTYFKNRKGRTCFCHRCQGTVARTAADRPSEPIDRPRRSRGRRRPSVPG